MATVQPAAPPAHERVYRLLLREIAAGSLTAGERLPPERLLCGRLGVSRTTLRRALRALAEQGLIESTVGRGTFVVDRTPEPFSALASFTELAERRGFVPTSRVLQNHVRPATIEEAEALRVVPGSELFELERVRLLDGLPVALHLSRIALSRAPGLPGVDFSDVSLTKTLAERYEITLGRGDYVIEAITADERQAELLDHDVGGPLLVAHETSYDSDDRPVDLARLTYRGDRYRFRASLGVAAKTPFIKSRHRDDSSTTSMMRR